MFKYFVVLSFLTCGIVWGHVPSLLLPIKGTPIASYFIGQIEISRAIYSELTQSEDFFILYFNNNGSAETSIEVLTPVCPQIPSYEEFQPSVLILKGDLPWKTNGESNKDFIARLEKLSSGRVESNYKKGERPQYYEEYGKHTYWVGGKKRLKLEAGLYALVVYNTGLGKGNFTIGINENESWTSDLYKYAGDIITKISEGMCSPKGFSGTLKP